jgi:hypothetical protein
MVYLYVHMCVCVVLHHGIHHPFPHIICVCVCVCIYIYTSHVLLKYIYTSHVLLKFASLALTRKSNILQCMRFTPIPEIINGPVEPLILS